MQLFLPHRAHKQYLLYKHITNIFIFSGINRSRPFRPTRISRIFTRAIPKSIKATGVADITAVVTANRRADNQDQSQVPAAKEMTTVYV